MNSRLTWALGALFVACGAALLFIDDAEAGRIVAGSSTFFLGAWALSVVRDAVRTGQVRFHSTVRQANQPRLFWATLALTATAGVGVWAAGVRVVFFAA